MNTEQIWKEHPTLEVVYVTSDETAFYNENDAKNHAKGLENKSVEPVYNPAHLAVDAKLVEGNDEPELSDFTKAQLIQFAKDNQLEVNDKANKPEILASIQTQMEAKNQADENGSDASGGSNPQE
ncbi:hypothetical protein [Flavobacterium suncheonense]|uniref:Uncharacterized protein n=1 Tax=Flavobacterium suncheonense GH29-5 = DSM 17707 TaxID=1121899 RepID=A0A0A2MBW0_9FLAO|nr:hypothetical protein [Flavobacterium suncheonense]KGO89739.1 hypothetical protein Q764_05980 [Flavobacterium suncheonense GH29-5 = DSM 17707]